jgi:hypothetical protein
MRVEAGPVVGLGLDSFLLPPRTSMSQNILARPSVITSLEPYAGTYCLQVRIAIDKHNDLHVHLFPFTSDSLRDQAIARAAKIIAPYFGSSTWMHTSNPTSRQHAFLCLDLRRLLHDAVCDTLGQPRSDYWHR